MLITELQLDTLKEIINIGVGKSASSLNRILHKRVSLEVPHIEIIHYNEVQHKIAYHKEPMLSIVKMEFNGELKGLSELVFPNEGAIEIVKIISNEANLENGLNDQLKTNSLSEIGNMILNALIGTIGNILKTRIRYNIPKYFECKPEDIVENVNPKNSQVIYAETVFRIVNENISGSFIIFLEVDSYDRLLQMLDNYISNYTNPKT